MGKAFFDDSGHELQPGYYGVAGFVGSDDQWRTFDQLWGRALADSEAPYLHMREFAHSTGVFKDWKGDRERREKLISDVVNAIKESQLLAAGTALRIEDYDSLTEAQRERIGPPYYGCFQDVLYGFALVSQSADEGDSVIVTADRQVGMQGKAQDVYNRTLSIGTPYDRLATPLRFRNMREPENFGLQAADLLAYELTKELSNQDRRPEDRMRWPMDQILNDQVRRGLRMIAFRTREYLEGQGNGIMGTPEGDAIVERGFEEMMRIYREN